MFCLRVFVFLVCLVSAAFANTRFLAITDIHYGSKNTSEAGADTGDGLQAISMEKFKVLSKDVDFILNLGDLPKHLRGPSSERELYEKIVFHALFEADAYKKPMFYISGNNDSLAGNYQPFEVDGKSPLNFATDWQGACVYCKGLLIDDSFMRSKGYYSTYAMPNKKDLILIVLNATQWTKTRFFSPHYPNQDVDAQEQFAWLEKQLRSLKAKQLLIAMHEAPGNNFLGFDIWQEKYLAQFIALLAKYKSNFGQITLLTSHSHMDEIRKITLPNGEHIYGFSTPSISRIHYNNAGLKVFELDDELRMKDFTTYYTKSNTSWGADSYQALGGLTPIFPNCRNKTLAQCLDDMSDGDVCNYIEKGLIYGVKSEHVSNKACWLTYVVS